MSKLAGNPIFQISERTAALVVALCGVNEDISYASLSGQVGFPVRGTPALTSARRILANDKIIFETVFGEGLRRLDDAGTVKSTERIKRGIHRASKRGTKRLGAVKDFAALPLPLQLQSQLNATVFDAIRQASIPTKPQKKMVIETASIAAMLKQVKEQST